MSWVYLNLSIQNRLSRSLPLAYYSGWGWGKGVGDASEWGLETRVDKKVPGARQATQESTTISVIFSENSLFLFSTSLSDFHMILQDAG